MSRADTSQRFAFRRLAKVLSMTLKSQGFGQPAGARKPGGWLREACVYAVLYGVPLFLLFPYAGWRPDGEFLCSLRTQAVDFTVGDYKKAGPFVVGCADVSFEGFSRIKLPAATTWQPAVGTGTGGTVQTLWGGTVTFHHVDFHSLLLTSGTSVRLHWYESSPEGVAIRLTYDVTPSAPSAAVFLDGTSAVKFSRSSSSEPGAPADGIVKPSDAAEGLAEIYPADRSLIVSVSPCPQPAPSVPLPTVAAAAQNGAAKAPPASEKRPYLPAENGIPLSPGSGVAFVTDEGDSAVLEGANSVEVRNADRKETLFRGQRLEFGELKNRGLRDPSTISLEIKDGIMVHLLGRAGHIQIDGEDSRPSVAEYLRAKKILGTWLATSILVGSALLTIVSRVKLVKLDEK